MKKISIPFYLIHNLYEKIVSLQKLSKEGEGKVRAKVSYFIHKNRNYLETPYKEFLFKRLEITKAYAQVENDNIVFDTKGDPIYSTIEQQELCLDVITNWGKKVKKMTPLFNLNVTEELIEQIGVVNSEFLELLWQINDQITQINELQK